MIPEKIVKSHHALLVKFSKGELIFREGTEALHYFQIEEGSVKMVSRSEGGQEFIQGISIQGESFGEPPLLCNFSYPSSAIALLDSKVWKIRKADFYNLIKENFEIHLKLDQILCERLHYKNKVIASMAFDSPENSVMRLITLLKSKSRQAHNSEKFIVPLTRQQMADMIGLRVETVIRSVKKLEENGKICLVRHKILV